MAICTGSPQGSCLSPVIFIINTSDINLWMSNTILTLYADDIYQWTSDISINEIILALERDLKMIIKFASSNKLILNPHKTHFIIFRHSLSDHHQRTIIVGNEIIHESAEIKILGLTINNELNWKRHLDLLTNSLRSRLFLLRKLSRNIPRRCLISILDGFFLSKNSLWTRGIWPTIAFVRLYATQTTTNPYERGHANRNWYAHIRQDPNFKTSRGNKAHKCQL